MENAKFEAILSELEDLISAAVDDCDNTEALRRLGIMRLEVSAAECAISVLNRLGLAIDGTELADAKNEVPS